jgi:TPP-dependent pyruvate/acetoin dehydrogenase alpha subunit
VLIEHGIATAGDVAEMRKSVLDETNEATDAAEMQPYPLPSDIYTNIYEGAWQPWQS